jgi:GTP cyclohydrolase I
LRLIYLTCFKEIECGKRNEMTIGKTNKGMARNAQEMMGSYKRKKDIHKVIEVSVSENKKEIILAKDISSSRSKR